MTDLLTLQEKDEFKRYTAWNPVVLCPQLCEQERVIGLTEYLLESGFVNSCVVDDTSFGCYAATQLAKGKTYEYPNCENVYSRQKYAAMHSDIMTPLIYLVASEGPEIKLKHIASNVITHSSLNKVRNINDAAMLTNLSNAETETHVKSSLFSQLNRSQSPKIAISKLINSQGISFQSIEGVSYTHFYLPNIACESEDGPDKINPNQESNYWSWAVLVRNDSVAEFTNLFSKRLQQNALHFDNLINIVIMVKDAGETWETILGNNLKFADRFTIVDTGSTDSTIETACRVLGDSGIPWAVYTNVPFVDFSTTRNVSLDLAGTSCAYNIMLDDTYFLNGDLRTILFNARADTACESFSLYIRDIDTTYSSNRITRPRLKKLRYVNTIHEVIEENHNVCLPQTRGWITDVVTEGMQTRTSNRKDKDLELLFKELEKKPGCSRSIFYLAETYMYMKKYRKAYDYYKWRALIIGGKQHEEERYDAIYKAGVIGHMYCHENWETSMNFLLNSYVSNPTRIDPLYVIISYYLNRSQGIVLGKPEDPPLISQYYERPDLEIARCSGYLRLALMYAREAMQIPFNNTTQHISIRETLYHISLPIEVMKAALYSYDGQLMCDAAKKMNDFASNPNSRFGLYDKTACMNRANWSYNAGQLLQQVSYYEWDKHLQHLTRAIRETVESHHNQLVVFVAPDGWESWDGEVLQNIGLGGSETCVVKYAETMANEHGVAVLVFCKRDSGTFSEKEKAVPLITTFKGVTYISADLFPLFVSKRGPLETLDLFVKACIVSRRHSYVPLACSSPRVQGVHVMLHDIHGYGVPFFINKKLKRIMYLSPWHRLQIEAQLECLEAESGVKERLGEVTYGIDVSDYCSYLDKNASIRDGKRQAAIRFIYPSFPNRGLVYLLRMFPKIVAAIPNATLDVFVRFDLEYLQTPEIDEIKKLLEEQSAHVTNHGWVTHSILKEFWKKAHIWLYPCVFEETFCKVGQEAAASKTLAIAPPLAALATTVGERGVLIPGDASTEEWATAAVSAVVSFADNGGASVKVNEQTHDVTELVQKNYDWALSCSHQKVVNEFIVKIIN